MAHHHNFAKLALRELSELEEAISTALQLVKLEETLVIVTADHSHAFTINGYPKRGNDILGFANDPSKPNVPAYETLSYINGPGFFYHRRNDSSNVNETWRPVDRDQTRGDPYYTQMAGIYLEDETHGGEDVGVYAIGNARIIYYPLFYFSLRVCTRSDACDTTHQNLSRYSSINPTIFSIDIYISIFSRQVRIPT